jgi:two-component system, sensor histidine kinase PdtaS
MAQQPSDRKLSRRVSEAKALERSEARFRQIVELAPSAMVMVDGSGTIELINAQAERLFGYERSELLGQSIETLVPERFRACHEGSRDAYSADPKSRPMGVCRDVHARKKDGTEFPVEIGLNLIETGAGARVLSAIVDITERKQREERIRSALREKDILLGEVLHRVKNNLQVIDSLLDLQSAKTSDPAALELLRESQNRVRSMAQIHQSLYQSKDFGRVDFGNFLENLVPALLSSYGIGPERIAVAINSSHVLLPIDAAIPCGLAVNELISNALKHAFPASREGEIRIDLDREDAGQVVLTVSDNGVGLPDALGMEQPATLGLQLVSLLADQLGGNLSVQKAKPTRFTLRFPAEK